MPDADDKTILYPIFSENSGFNGANKWIFTKKVIQLNKDDPCAHNYLGVICYNQDIHSEAIYEYKKAIDIYPSYLQAAINLITACETNGMIAEAISETKRAIDNASNEDNQILLIRKLRSLEETQLNVENN